MPSTATDRLDGLTTSVAVKAPCKAYTTSTITQSGEQTIGGVACVDGDRYLYDVGTSAAGIWVVRTGAHERAKDFDGNRDVVQGTLVGVVGDNSSVTLYRVTNANPITIGTTAIDFALSGIADAANMVLDGGETYAAGTIGAWVTQELSVFKFIPSQYHAAILAGTSTVDVSSYIIDAIDAAILLSPCRLVFPTGYYKCDSVLGTFTNVSNLRIDGQGSILDFGAVQTSTFDRALYITGSYGATAALTSNAADLAQTLAVTSTGFAAKDWVRIYSSTVWDSTRTSTKIGEINQIDTVPGGTSVTVVTPIQTAYTTAATATLQKLTMCRNVHISGFTFIGPSANDQLGCIEIRLGLECSITKNSSRDFDNRHFRFVDCVLSHISENHFEEAVENSQAYAISFADATQDCRAFGNTMRNVRHAFTTNNNTSTSYGITRRCVVSYNQVYNNIPNDGGTSGDALDTHAGSEDITFEHNTVMNAYGVGINIEGRSGVAHGNKVYGSTASGVRLASYVDGEESEYQVTDNELITIGDGSSNDYGIVVAPQVLGVKRLLIANNKVQSINNALEIQGTSSRKVKNFEITGNHFEVWDPGSGTIGTGGVMADYVEQGTISANWASGPTRGIQALNCLYTTISANYAQITASSGSTGYAIAALGVSSYVAMCGNTVRYTSSGISSTIGVVSNAGSDRISIQSNVTQGFGTNVSSGGGTGSVAANNV